MGVIIRVFVFSCACFYLTFAFGQEGTKDFDSLQKRKELLNIDPKKAYHLLMDAATQAKARHDKKNYLECVNLMASINFKNMRKEQGRVFREIREALNKEGGSDPNLHFHAGEFYADFDYDIDSALIHFTIARDLWSESLGENSEFVANCYHGIGDVYKYLKYDYLEAERYYNKALLIREGLAYVDPITLARNYYNLATTNRSQQDFAKALSYGVKTISIVKERNRPDFLENGYSIVANIYRDMGQGQLAKEYYNKAIALNLEVNKSPENLAWHYQGLGITYKMDSSFHEAVDNFRKALNIYEKIQVNEKLLHVNCLGNLAETFLMEGNFKAAWKIYSQLTRKVKNLNLMDEQQGAEVYFGFGNYYAVRNMIDSALFYYQKSLTTAVKPFKSMDLHENPSSEMIGTQYYVHNIILRKALGMRVKFAETNDEAYLESSLRSLVLAEQIMSEGRNSLDVDDSKWKFLEQNYNVYEQLLSTLLTLYKLKPEDSLFNMVFRYFELSKSRTLVDELIRAQQTGDLVDEGKLVSHYEELKKSLYSIQHRLNGSEQKDSDKLSDEPELQAEMVKIDRKLQQQKQYIEKKIPVFFKARYEQFLPELHHMRRYTREKERVLLEYFWGGKDVYAIGVFNEDVIYKNLGSRDSIGEVVINFLSHFVNNDAIFDHARFQTFVSRGHLLYQYLLQPFESLLKKSRHLQIIPDGMISQLPFETFLIEGTHSSQIDYRSLHYVIRDYTITYAYSSMTLGDSEVKDRVLIKPSILAMGFTNGVRLPDQTQLPQIEGAEKELQALHEHFNQGRFLIGSEVTESNFKKMAPEFDIIHLAVHGKGNVDENFSSALYFQPGGTSDDGELNAYELYGLKFKAHLAVLTSCESGLGKSFKGEGMMSMASAFASAGCENILMSLWKVNDQTSVHIMNSFYDNLLKGEEIGRSLASAKLSYLESSDELSANPTIWAPLVAYGRADKIVRKDRSIVYVLAGSILLLSLSMLLFFILKRKFTMKAYS